VRIYGITRDPETLNYMIVLEYTVIEKTFRSCFFCDYPRIYDRWCKICNSKRFQQNFGKWTSGNEHIDKFIQEIQLEARDENEVMEWIPYDRLRNIQYFVKGGFSTNYKAIWLDGYIVNWNFIKQDWKRHFNSLEVVDYENAKKENT